ncbi:hypothetical protein PENFLA_c045G05717 [Penicillium flavigenum]|uniref:Uncharacterized protein n=1 Tax=Penicillium flavigenum TaxID=254877 RepID=A0A1V6SIV9_9EURO|nr:hypothetical protein PENFLA_c045G05717 [Penicillium flavigenum]
MSSKFAEERKKEPEEKQRQRDDDYRAFMADFMGRAYELQRRSASPARVSQASPRQRSPRPEPPRPRTPRAAPTSNKGPGRQDSLAPHHPYQPGRQVSQAAQLAERGLPANTPSGPSRRGVATSRRTPSAAKEEDRPPPVKEEEPPSSPPEK